VVLDLGRGGLGLGVVPGGVVLVTARSKSSQGILCTANLSDASENPPSVMVSLDVVQKDTQQGD
jgi:flavin reductase (DIM6/NTAB) family NADH-FMN oxidoreductase RutF